ncbi:hypothetical protein QQP08_020185 [Theobroma cacao]|uniref:Secreted protein n=1 Tax=Theobroma cacao TaxID=3641 RepID=A0A061GAR2_THECC|nr:Uncharacterized protein TCM_028935 [Theobroma cacao]WRX27698.1 hypothetical protein QQP08_020185 [Theobroma cacao]
MPGEYPRSFLITFVIFALVLSPMLPCDAVRLIGHPAPIEKQPICPVCVCCTDPPPGHCCRCCASSIGSQRSQMGSP